MAGKGHLKILFVGDCAGGGSSPDYYCVNITVYNVLDTDVRSFILFVERLLVFVQSLSATNQRKHSGYEAMWDEPG